MGDRLYILVIEYGCGTVKTLQDTNEERIRDYHRFYRSMNRSRLIEVEAPTGWETWTYEVQEAFALAHKEIQAMMIGWNVGDIAAAYGHMCPKDGCGATGGFRITAHFPLKRGNRYVLLCTTCGYRGLTHDRPGEPKKPAAGRPTEGRSPEPCDRCQCLHPFTELGEADHRHILLRSGRRARLDSTCGALVALVT